MNPSPERIPDGDGPPLPGIFGILNLTADSFSDGGRYLEPEAALAHARQLVADGADVVDVGAESTNPKGADVDAAEEIRRLEAVVPPLVGAGVAVSVDTRKPAVMAWAADRGVAWLNDVTGFRDPDAMAVAARATTGLVCMFNRSADGRARRDLAGDPADVVAECAGFFRDRTEAFAAAGIQRERIVFDPGMGFFLGPDPGFSTAILRALPELCAKHRILVSVSRKSFLGDLCGGSGGGRDVSQRGPATLAAELHTARAGVAWLRTHEPRALKDGLLVQRALGARPWATGPSAWGP